ncbi:hypothetical protein Zmor_027225 [Zophobas morio]|uniref:Lipase n=1 Tax=Zophobas morio TaxID=2755281 RepID=A0AA38HT84_9CUCU|nr:hypothetical protein Zmor_027225 [Zophobas morio]
MKRVFWLIIPLIVALIFSPQKQNNTCKSYLSYFNIFFSSDCYHNPDQDDDILGIIQRHVGVHETHEVQTDDGYFLTLFRIPRQNPRGVIFFQHPLTTDARVWVGQYNESVAFLFWRAGYDVWLGNIRGSHCCKKHVSLDPTEAAFWNFSFHEIGYYDNHASIEYVKQQTGGSKIIYLGYSLGGTSGMVYASTRDKEAVDSVKMMVVITPTTHLQLSCTSLLKYLLFISYNLQGVVSLADPLFVFNRQDAWYAKMGRFLVTHFPCKKCMLYFSYLFVGFPEDAFEPDLINMFVRVHMSEYPLKMLYHYYQMYVVDGIFQRYDYGEEGNLLQYGTKEPTSYLLENIKVPVYIVSGANDNLDCPNAIEKLYNLLPKNSTAHGKLMVEGFNHLDYAYGRYRNEKVYFKILQLLDKIHLDDQNCLH